MFFDRNIFNNKYAAKTLEEVYNTEFNMAKGGFVWASEMEFNYVMPEAVKVCNLWKGTFLWGQLN
jgi:hypothetical protein